MSIRTWGRHLMVALLCVLTLCGNVQAAGKQFPDVPKNADYATAVRCLSEIEVIVGFRDGEFKPDATITRAQAAAIMCRLKGVAKKAEEIKKSPFTDVPETHWAEGYIAVAEDLGIINGYSDETFRPDNTLTYAHMLTIIVNAWGYADMAKYSGGWPDGYLAVAKEYGIIEGDVDGDAPCPRAAVAQMCFKALLVDKASWTK